MDEADVRRQGRYLFLSYDRRGHGESEAPLAGYHFAYAEDLNALLTFLGIAEAHFLGSIPWRSDYPAAAMAAKTSSFTRVAQSLADVRDIMNRMVDQYSLRIAQSSRRSDFTAAMNIGPWNLRDFPAFERLSQPMLLVVGERSDLLFRRGAEEAQRFWPNTRLRAFGRVRSLADARSARGI